MPSDSDKLLAWLRAREEDCLLVADAALPKHVPLVQAEIDRIGRYIAVVEELVAFKADQEQSGGHDVLCERHDSGD